MGSLNAAAVARDALRMVAKGQKVNHRLLLLKHGYSKSISERPCKVTKTKSYMAVMKNVPKAMEKERARIIEAMGNKDLSAEKYATLITGADVLTKNIQLLSGKSTENIGMIIEVSESIAKKNATKGEASQTDKSTI